MHRRSIDMQQKYENISFWYSAIPNIGLVSDYFVENTASEIRLHAKGGHMQVCRDQDQGVQG